MVESLIANRRREQAAREAQAFQEEQQNRRYELQLRNQYAIHAADLQAEAKKIASQRTYDWRKSYWTSNINNYHKQLDQTETELNRYLDPDRLWEKSPESVKQAKQILKWIPQQRHRVAQGTPQDFDSFHDPSDLMSPAPVEFAPAESEEYKTQRLKKAQLSDLNIDRAQVGIARTRQLIEKGNRPATNTKKANSFLSKRSAFIGATQNFYNTQPDIDQGGYMSRDFGRKSGQAAKTWTTKSAAFLGYLSDPELVGPDVSTLVRETVSQYNNLSTPADYHNWLNDLSKADYSGDGGQEAHQTVTRLHSLVTDPTYDPFEDQGGEEE